MYEITIEYFDDDVSVYICKDCRYFDGVVELTGVDGEAATTVLRLPLYKVRRVFKRYVHED